MEDTGRPTIDKATHARTSQACQRCRSLKTRCLPSERSGTCQRCLNAKRDCVWADTPRRPRRVRGPSRISQVEQKIDGLVASLVHPESLQSSSSASAPEEPASGILRNPSSDAASNERPLAPGSWLPFPTSFERRDSNPEQIEEAVQPEAEPTHQFLDKLRQIHSFSDTQDLSRPPEGIFHGSQKTEPAIANEKVQELLVTDEADILLNEYRAMSTSFPFIPIPPLLSASQIHAAKPMLFLAIITVASWKDHKRQLWLDEVYRTELANRTIIRPRRTISLLQSILVYLSRYHFVFSHKTQQIYFMQQLAVGLALDLGLHQRSVRPPIDFPGRPPPQPPSQEEQWERQRTLLGCYYLSSMVAGGLQKPNLLKFTNYMAECGRSLRKSSQYPSDGIIGHLVNLRRLDDQIHDSFLTEETVDLPLTDPRISMNFRFLETQLEDWKKAECGEEFKRLVDLSSSFTDMQLHCIALRSPVTTDQPPSADPTRLNALLATLEACKRFFDTLLAFPISEYYLISFSEWMRIPFVVITLARLCIPSEAHDAVQWDVKTAYERARLDLYLESLCYRMQSLSTFKKSQRRHPDFYWAMEMIMDLTKSWFARKIKAKSTASAQGTPSGLPTPDTMHSSNQGSSWTGPPSTSSGDGAGGYHHAMLGAMNMDTSGERSGNGPFDFMRDADFDMDKFFDMGLWGDESYVGMGFGGGMGF